ncbi:ABC transporter ATP-binding protein [Streptomyces sp. NBC_00893]|uniref:ABC transporter ATP-binding protein n=1 Tax=Streptomyces sp. NBC_00893 TaxID=2975862 RepID=UPI00224EFDA8|nr:ABC transporter ATP-binding protein [Streptomyces sp. NBC_00893]MCX4849508.1 ABC transporter ATP-binding protein/permease [Streptomyces sp. NBC_00893]
MSGNRTADGDGQDADRMPGVGQDREEGAALRALLRPVRGRIALGVALQALAGIASLGSFIAIHPLAVALLEEEPDEPKVWWIVGFAALALVVRFVAQSLSYLLMHDADMEFQLRLRRRIAGRLSRVPLGWFSGRNSATVKKALADDVESMHYLVAHALPDLTTALVVPVAAVVYLFALDWRLALVTLVTTPVFGVLFRMTGKRGGRQHERLAGAVVGINTAVIELVQGIAVIKAFGQRDKAGKRYSKAVEDYMVTFTAVKGPLLSLSSIAYASVSPAVMLATSLGGGTLFAAAGWMRPVDVLPFVLLGLAITAPLVVVTYAPQAFGQARQAADRVAELLVTPTLAEPEQPLTAAGHVVEFRDVTFGYTADSPVLRNIGLTLEPGTVTALVGPSGAGKSTLAALLPRFFDPDQGSVRIGGVDLRDMAAQELYGHVAFVFQDVRLLRATIADNIRMARPDATLAEVHAAAQAARCHDRILELPRGYDSVVGEDALLSGGETQRVAIARALFADTPVIVLDEATAFVDPEAEAAIYDALSALIAGRTVLFVAHRLHTIVDADQIVVLEHGRVVERGTHTELLDSGPVYRGLWEACTESGAQGQGHRIDAPEAAL